MRSRVLQKLLEWQKKIGEDDDGVTGIGHKSQVDSGQKSMAINK